MFDATPPSPVKKRMCYCDGLDAEFRREHHIPNGFCGFCEVCGQPGHTRHHPAPVPYTGAWCDHCYRILVWIWPFRLPVGWFMLVIMALIIALLVSFITRLF
jgi:hypothetical protein